MVEDEVVVTVDDDITFDLFDVADVSDDDMFKRVLLFHWLFYFYWIIDFDALSAGVSTPLHWICL